MGHGRIFEFSSDRKRIEAENFDRFDEESLRENINGCDYVNRQRNNNLVDDLIWYFEDYGVPVQMDILGNFVVGIINKKGIEEVKNRLLEEKHKRIERIKHMLKNDEEIIDMWKISYEAYVFSVCYFVDVDNDDFGNEMDFLKYCVNKAPKEIIILGSYDYHV